MIIDQAGPSDHAVWAAMLARLHSGTADEFEAELAEWTALPEPYVGFIARDEHGTAIGMIDLRVRNCAEGAPKLSAAYVEDLWVQPQHRRAGVATALLAEAEHWAREQGIDWLGSDAEIDNRQSHAWHRAAGFEEVERLVVFGKALK